MFKQLNMKARFYKGLILLLLAGKFHLSDAVAATVLASQPALSSEDINTLTDGDRKTCIQITHPHMIVYIERILNTATNITGVLVKGTDMSCEMFGTEPAKPLSVQSYYVTAKVEGKAEQHTMCWILTKVENFDGGECQYNCGPGVLGVDEVIKGDLVLMFNANQDAATPGKICELSLGSANPNRNFNCEGPCYY